MDDQEEYDWGLVIRLGAGVLLIGVGLCMGVNFLALFTVFAGGALLAGPIKEWWVRPDTSLFRSEEPPVRIPPMYGTIDAKLKKGLYEEAMSDYRAILAEYPDEAKAFVGMIELAAVHMRDRARAEQIYQEALANVKEADQPGVTKVYIAMTSDRPEWLTTAESTPLRTPGSGERDGG